jgi:hypothetical protein
MRNVMRLSEDWRINTLATSISRASRMRFCEPHDDIGLGVGDSIKILSSIPRNTPTHGVS